MRCVMVMFDSLNRHMLPPYNADTWVKAPNFQRLARRTATFDRSYVCSMPCMPTRRDFHTGRLSFLHCPWGPLEPFDDSVPEMLSKAGVYTHLISDHYHYWEDNAATYHGRYDSWEAMRGQEGDPFVGQVADPVIPENLNGKGRRPDWVNRMHIREDSQYPQTQTFDAGVKFLDMNHDQDNWFVQIECFDPHEPFTTDPKWRELYPSCDDVPLFDWPPYGKVTETPEQVEAARRNYAALMTKCDASLGRILDKMDEHDMWDDTMLIVWTDHGYMLGEHGCWAKNWMPLYEEVAHTPFFVWDPRCPQAAGERRAALAQPAIDLGPTMLNFFGQAPTPHMTGKDLAATIAEDTPVRDMALFGYFNNRVNITDGRYIYLRDPVMEGGAQIYTLMPVRMRRDGHTLDTGLAEPFSFTKGMSTLRIPGRAPQYTPRPVVQHLLFDLDQDPTQQTPLTDEKVESRLCQRMAELMAECEAPAEQYTRMGLDQPANVRRAETVTA